MSDSVYINTLIEYDGYITVFIPFAWAYGVIIVL